MAKTVTVTNEVFDNLLNENERLKKENEELKEKLKKSKQRIRKINASIPNKIAKAINETR